MKKIVALALACCTGSVLYNAGLFAAHVEGLAGNAGSTGANPMNVVLNIVPANIITAFGSNTSVLAVVFLAVCLGLSMNALGGEKTATLRKLVQELNDVVVVFLNYVVNKFGPFAIFVLLVRTFATYGINHLRPAFAYVVAAVALLLLYLVVGYPLIVAVGARKNPITFLKKSARWRCSASPPPPAPPPCPSTIRPAPRIWGWMKPSPPSSCPWAPPSTWTAPPFTSA